MRAYAIIAARAKTGKKRHVRKFVQATSQPKALRAYGCNVRGRTRSVVTSRGWRITAEPVQADA